MSMAADPLGPSPTFRHQETVVEVLAAGRGIRVTSPADQALLARVQAENERRLSFGSTSPSVRVASPVKQPGATSSPPRGSPGGTAAAAVRASSPLRSFSPFRRPAAGTTDRYGSPTQTQQQQQQQQQQHAIAALFAELSGASSDASTMADISSGSDDSDDSGGVGADTDGLPVALWSPGDGLLQYPRKSLSRKAHILVAGGSEGEVDTDTDLLSFGFTHSPLSTSPMSSTSKLLQPGPGSILVGRKPSPSPLSLSSSSSSVTRPRAVSDSDCTFGFLATLPDAVVAVESPRPKSALKTRVAESPLSPAKKHVQVPGVVGFKHKNAKTNQSN
jgi:hypothetical protein